MTLYQRVAITLSVPLALLLQACVAGTTVDRGVSEAQPEPELTLNLPARDCVCADDEGRDYTFFDKGFAELVAGDHIEAVKYFQSYQRLESSPETDWEAGIAIAYDSMLPQSPFYDPSAAREAYERLQGAVINTELVYDKALLMRDALTAFMALQDKIDKLRGANRDLGDSLQKRQKALKRLRDLTLGQKGVTP